MDAKIVLCAVDLGPLTSRVVLHAAGLARVMGAGLRILHVGTDASTATHERVMHACLAQAPYEIALEPEEVLVRTGRVSDAIHREARRLDAAIVVIGSRGRRGLARFVMGSTSTAVLKNAAVPILIVPPTDTDIVSLGDRARLTCGPVLAAVDLGSPATQQLAMASEMAALADEPLLLMTVPKSRISDRDAALELRRRAHGLAPAAPHAMIVRRGAVVEEIVRCARHEGAGLVVVGIDAHHRPGVVAPAILAAGMAFVLAVPGAPLRSEQPVTYLRTMAPVASLLLVLALTTGGAAQVRFNDETAIVHFQRAADTYAFLHRQIERRLGMVHHATPDFDAMAAAMREARPDAMAGELLTPDVVAAIRVALARAARASDCGWPETGGGAGVRVHDSARGTIPLPACLAAVLPHLPIELEFRSAGDALVLVDVHADLVVDLISGVFSTTMS